MLSGKSKSLLLRFAALFVLYSRLYVSRLQPIALSRRHEEHPEWTERLKAFSFFMHETLSDFVGSDDTRRLFVLN